MGRHATSRDFRSARQRQVNGEITGENPEGFARRVEGGSRSSSAPVAVIVGNPKSMAGLAEED
jgi:hypothetical protein